jgi:hypothetical protein
MAGGPSPSSFIDQNSTHRHRSDRQKVRAVTPLHAGLVHEPDIRLVYESAAVQGVTLGFPPKLPPGETTQLAVNQWKRAIERSLIPG